jgi:hypothetical protein
VSWRLTGSPPCLALISEWGLIGATHWGQQGTPALMLPYMRAGLSAADGGVGSVPQVLHVSPHAPRIHAQRVARCDHHYTHNYLSSKELLHGIQ